MFEVQKKQALNETNIEFEKAKSQFETQRMQAEAEIKRQLLEVEFVYDMQLEKQKMGATSEKEVMIENRKDERSKQEATQQSELINQSQNNALPKNFETPINSNQFGV